MSMDSLYLLRGYLIPPPLQGLSLLLLITPDFINTIMNGVTNIMKSINQLFIMLCGIQIIR